MMMIFRFCFCVFFCLAFFNCKKIEEKPNLKAESSISKKPNVLIIFPDQLRRYSAGYWSEEPYKNHVVGKPDPVITPNIDMLAKNGVVFTKAISNFPLCSPYRGMLISGRYPEQNGIWNNCRVGRNESLKDDISTIPSLFHDAGYNTSYFGKCHWLRNDPFFDENGNYVGTKEAPGGHHLNKYDTYIPEGSRHSIEYFYQALKDEHYNPHVFSNDPYTIEGKKDGELHLPKIFSPKNESKIIIDYLKNTRGQRDPDKPFCMMWSLNPPHNPWNDESTDMEVYKEYYDIDKFPNLDKSLVVRDNASLEAAKHARYYFANVTSTDKYIGLVLDELKKMDELDNTIILFSSDHGELLGSHGLKGKNHLELESLAIPLIIHWPKGLKPSVSDAIFSVPDVLPTVMGLAGLSDQLPSDIEGINFSSHIKNPNNPEVKKPKSALIMLSNSRGVQTDRYTLSVTKRNKKAKTKEAVFIYDNLKDPYQLNKIDIKTIPEVSKNLLKELAILLKTTNDPWYKNNILAEIIPY